MELLRVVTHVMCCVLYSKIDSLFTSYRKFVKPLIFMFQKMKRYKLKLNCNPEFLCFKLYTNKTNLSLRSCHVVTDVMRCVL